MTNKRDIIVELKEVADFMYQGKAVYAHRQCMEAIDEIVRLRKEVERLLGMKGAGDV